MPTCKRDVCTHGAWVAPRVQIHVVDASGTTDREGQLVDTDAEQQEQQEPQEQQQAAVVVGGDKKPATARGGDPLDDVG